MAHEDVHIVWNQPSAKILGMTIYAGRLLVATERGVYELVGDEFRKIEIDPSPLVERPVFVSRAELGRNTRGD